MRLYYYLLSLLSLCLLSACQGQYSTEEIFLERASGVVLVQCKYYFKAEGESGTVYYFPGVVQSADGEYFIPYITTDRTEVEPHEMTGTGFVISDEGEILTNRHVVSGDYSLDVVERAFRSYIDGSLHHANGELREMESHEDYLNERLQELQAYNDPERQDSIQEVIEELKDLRKMNEAYTKTLKKLRKERRSTCKVELISEVSIIYNEQDISQDSPATPCFIRHVAEEDYLDLALIQTKDKQVRFGTYIFDFKALSKHNELKLGDKLYMIGYNAGFDLAHTSEGIRAQITSGEISQFPTSTRVLYSIPVMPGSSGSPVMNEQGKLVAINFAKMRESDNFNFGIPAPLVAKYLEERLPVKVSNTTYYANSYKTEERQANIEIDSEDALNTINLYWQALEEEEPKAASYLFSPNGVEQFHKLKNTTRHKIEVELHEYLKKYKVEDCTVIDFRRHSSNTNFYYELHLRLKRNSDNKIFYFQVKGIMNFVIEERQTYINSMDDFENTLLKSSAPEAQRTESVTNTASSASGEPSKLDTDTLP